MRFSSSALVLSTLAAGQVFAASVAHRSNHAARHVEFMKTRNVKRGADYLTASHSSRLSQLGVGSAGLNPVAPCGTPWIGAGGPFTNEFFNQAAEDVILVIWGSAGSWVNANQPQITITIPAYQSQVVSFPSGASGAWSAIYSDTQLINGQVSNTWGEFTFDPTYGVVDVSREVNMGGHSMSIVGPTCTTDMNTCVFVCPDGQNTCMTGYQLLNCATGSQGGANFGTYAGAPSGGCGGMGNSAALKTYLG